MRAAFRRGAARGMIPAAGDEGGDFAAGAMEADLAKSPNVLAGSPRAIGEGPKIRRRFNRKTGRVTIKAIPRSYNPRVLKARPFGPYAAADLAGAYNNMQNAKLQARIAKYGAYHQPKGGWSPESLQRLHGGLKREAQISQDRLIDSARIGKQRLLAYRGQLLNRLASDAPEVSQRLANMYSHQQQLPAGSPERKLANKEIRKELRRLYGSPLSQGLPFARKLPRRRELTPTSFYQKISPKLALLSWSGPPVKSATGCAGVLDATRKANQYKRYSLTGGGKSGQLVNTPARVDINAASYRAAWGDRPLPGNRR